MAHPRADRPSEMRFLTLTDSSAPGSARAVSSIRGDLLGEESRHGDEADGFARILEEPLDGGADGGHVVVLELRDELLLGVDVARVLGIEPLEQGDELVDVPVGRHEVFQRS